MKNLAFDDSFWITHWRKISPSGSGLKIRDDLLKRYAENHRSYHTTQHLNECLNFFETYQSIAEISEILFFAIWYHDAVYKTTEHNNEQASADLAALHLTENIVSPDKITKIANLILITQHSLIPIAPDERLIVDIDLSILGASPQRFLEYENQIRLEYSFVPESIFNVKRREVLNGFHARPAIYNTPEFFSSLENQARSNLTKALA